MVREPARGPLPGERIRVLQIITRLNVGGPAIQATLLARGLDASRYDCLLVTGAEEPEEGNYPRLHGQVLEGLQVIPELCRPVRPLSDIRAIVRLARLMRRFRPHIVHTHTSKAGVVGRVAALLAGAPVTVHTMHGHVFRGYFPRPATRLLLGVERWLGRRTACLVTVAARVRRELLELGVGEPGKLRVIPPGLDLEPFRRCERRRGELRRELGWSEEHRLVGIVARLVPIKAHERFLQAAARVERSLPEARFVLVGDGHRRRALEALAAELGLRDRSRFLGWRSDLDRIYADLDLVALTSRNEGFPVSLIEALAAGRTVLATRVGGVPDLIEHGVHGVLVEAEDPEAFADQAVALLGDPERRRRLGEAGRRRVDPALGSQRLLADIDRLYTELLYSRGFRTGSW